MASVSVTGPNGAREIAVEDIPVGPGKISLTKGEVVTGVILAPSDEEIDPHVRQPQPDDEADNGRQQKGPGAQVNQHRHRHKYPE